MLTSVPPEFIKAAEQFNAHEFWESHETLEPLWLHAPEPLKTFLQGVIQTAAGFVHISNVNHKGAVSLLTQALEKLHFAASHEAVYQHWLNLPEFIAQVEDAKAEVERLTADNLHKFCPNKFAELHPLV